MGDFVAMITTMTIARDFTAHSGLDGDGARRGSWNETPGTSDDGEQSMTPAIVLEQRLAAQIRSFERAGYRLETRTRDQAIVAKPREKRPLRDAALIIGTCGLYALPLALGARRIFHRVVITVDQFGEVRLA